MQCTGPTGPKDKVDEPLGYLSLRWSTYDDVDHTVEHWTVGMRRKYPMLG